VGLLCAAWLVGGIALRAWRLTDGEGLAVTVHAGANFALPVAADAWPRLSFVPPRWLPAAIRERPFSIRCAGWLMVPSSTTYVFTAHSDDGCRFWIDDRLLLNSWKVQRYEGSAATATVALEKGWHPVRCEYFNAGGFARFRLVWKGGPIEKATVLEIPYLAHGRRPPSGVTP